MLLVFKLKLQFVGNFDVLGTANMFGLLFEQFLGFTQEDLVQKEYH